MEKWRKEAQITKKLGLRPCSMNRCCNAELVQTLKNEIENLLILKATSSKEDFDEYCGKLEGKYFWPNEDGEYFGGNNE